MATFNRKVNSAFSMMTNDIEEDDMIMFQPEGSDMHQLMPGAGQQLNMEDLTFDHSVDGIFTCNREDVHMCSNKICNQMTVTYQDHCKCGYVYYCSRSCKTSDTGHKCIDTPSIFKVDTEECFCFITGKREEPSGYVFQGTFSGIKRRVGNGDKYVRGRVTFPLGLVDMNDVPLMGFYDGEMTTIKVGGRMICIPDGKGTQSLYDKTVAGTFEFGFLHGNAHSTIPCNMVVHGKYDHGKPSDIIMVDTTTSKFFGVSREMVLNERLITSRAILASWKKSKASMCLDVRNNFDPVEVASSVVDGMEVSKVVYAQVVDGVKFRVAIVSDGEGYKYITMGVGKGCALHGKYTSAPMCPAIMDDIQEVVCTCPLPVHKESGHVPSKPVPTGVPRVLNIPTKRPSSCNPVYRSKGVHGVSNRDMSKKKCLHGLQKSLDEGKWALARQSNHLVYKREVDNRTQTFVCAKTPSTNNFEKKALSVLQRL